MKGFMRFTVKTLFVLALVWVLGLGLKQVPLLAGKVWDRCMTELNETYERLFVRKVIQEKRILVEKEPEYGDGVRGLVIKHAKRSKVPVALALAVASQESTLDASNMSVNIAAKYLRKGKDYKSGPERWKYTAWGFMQILPAFTMQICGYTDFREIYGPENLERNIECGIKRLRHDYEQYKDGSEYAKWTAAIVDYYGADVDGYKEQVLARVQRLAMTEEG